MEYKVIKKYFDPIDKRHRFPNETVTIKDEYLEGYKGYIEIPEVKPQPKVEKAEPVKEEAKPIEVVEPELEHVTKEIKLTQEPKPQYKPKSKK